MTDTVTVYSGRTATLLVEAGEGPTLLNNPGPNTVYLGDDNAIRATDNSGIVPLTANGFLNVDGQSDLFAITATGQVQAINKISGALNFFSPPSLSGLGGARVFVQTTAPTQPPTIPLNSIWFNTTNNSLQYWNGTTWVVQAFAGTQLIQAGTIVANLLAAGIVVAGIVDGTTINANLFQAFGNAGEYLGYSGSPAALGNLVYSEAAAATTDGPGNAILAGVTAYAQIAGGLFIATSMQAGQLNTYLSSSGAAGPYTLISSMNATSDGDVHYSAVSGARLVADTIWFCLDPVSGVRGVWNDLRPLSNSFVGTITNEYPPQYRIDPDGYVSVVGAVQFPGTGGPNFNSITFANLPLGFRPSNDLGFIAPIQLITNVTPVGTPVVQITPDGNLQFHNCPTSGLAGTTARINLRFPLARTGLIVS